MATSDDTSRDPGAQPGAGADEGPADSRRVATLLGALFGITAMGSASAAVALPEIGDHFGVDIGNATWVISLYALMLAVTTAVYGRVSDLVGVRWPLTTGIGLMVGGAFVAALAPSYPVLLAARLVQGAGAAAVPTLGVTILSARYTGRVRGVALGRLAGTGAAVASLGPLVGGVAEHLLGWRFVLALPMLGGLVLPFVWRALTGEGTRATLDILGAVLVAVTAAGAVLLVQSPSTGAVVAIAGLVLMIAGAPLVTLRVRRRPHGFLPLAVVRNLTVVRSAAAASAVPAAWFGFLIATPAVLIARGWEPWQVGLLLLPSSVTAMLMPRAAGALLGRLGPTAALGVSTVTATSALGLAAVGAGLGSGAMLGGAAVLVTLSFGLGQPALSAAVGSSVEPEVRGVALGVATLLFLVGGSIGSAVVGGVSQAIGMWQSLVVLAALPCLGLAVLSPELRGRGRGARPATMAG